MHTHPYLFTAGMAIIGFVFPEWLGILVKGNVRIPMGQNLICALAFGLIAYVFAF